MLGSVSTEVIRSQGSSREKVLLVQLPGQTVSEDLRHPLMTIELIMIHPVRCYPTIPSYFNIIQMPLKTVSTRMLSEQSESEALEGTQRERIPVLIFDDPGLLSKQVARRIATLVNQRHRADMSLVLGLPTGSTPIGVYQQLVTMHQEEGLDLSNVITFNLDEYYPIAPDSFQSYSRFMAENFFDHVNISAENIHIPPGGIETEEIESFCLRYEELIAEAGGLDLVLLGIGRSGHIGFNEPGSGPKTRTRSIILDEITRKDAASDFFGEENVPRQAITMGVGTILDAKELILMATGEHKAPILKRAVEEEPNVEVTATYLQLHANAAIYIDAAAAGELTRVKTPWVVRELDWNDELAERAVIWLSRRVGKAIMRLEQADFHRHHLHNLTYSYPSTDDLCKKVFENLRQKIVYQESIISESRVIVFSPHPDDDVISMGGMLYQLVASNNDTTIAYMTNGSVAVFDADVRRYLRFMELTGSVFGLKEDAETTVGDSVENIRIFLENKDPGEVDTDQVQKVKAYIRYAEAISAIEVMGLARKNVRFLDMPFYKTGRVRKDPISEEDVALVRELLEEIQPENIFVAGDLSDPHGTHRMCYSAIETALGEYVASMKDPARRPLVWLYRGAWQEWEIHQTDVFIPMFKADLDRKIEAIFKHESQKDRAMFPGAYDSREFWERARDRNRHTAQALNELGLPEFYAAEAYVTTSEL
ncbi:MAG: glucosamine-6-phosphate deaminase [Rhodothermia bacterium]|nr:MAG: glucosamine-6-phosphate deaminase [Rhodothermia bacterium]